MKSKTIFCTLINVTVYFSPQDKTLDVKKSSYKKLSKFLKEMQDRGLIRVKELSKGVESIVEVYKDHEE